MPRGPRIDYERVVDLTRQGLSAAVIAEKLHCTRRTVERARKAMGVSAQRSPIREWSPSEVAVASRLFDDGASAAEVGRTLGRSPTSVIARFPGRQWPVKQTALFAGECSRIARAMRRQDSSTFGAA